MTSQIFANIYLNELDRLVKHTLKSQFYLRYGDDFIIITQSRIEASTMRQKIVVFLQNELGLEINRKNDIIVPAKRGIYFLGVEIYPTGIRLKEKIWQKAQAKLDQLNVSSYHGIVQQFYFKKLEQFDWLISKLYD